MKPLKLASCFNCVFQINTSNGASIEQFRNESKFNRGSWEDKLPLTAEPAALVALNSCPPFTPTPPINNHHHHNHFTVKELHQSLTLGNNTRKRLEHTPSARTTSSEESWCSEGVASDRNISSEEEDDSNERSIIDATPRNSQLRLTFNKAKQHLSFDKWRHSHNSAKTPTPTENNNQQNPLTSAPITPNNGFSGNITMPATNTDASPTVEPFSRLSRWFSIRRGSTHNYEVEKNRNQRANSIETDLVDSSATVGLSLTKNNNRMPQLNETDEELKTLGLTQVNGTKHCATLPAAVRQVAPSLPPAPTGLNPQQLKRRHIVAAIVHSENSYVATLQRLVNDYKKPLEESNPPILSSTKIATLFHRLPEILQCHNMFRIAMAEAVRSWDKEEKLGDVFVASFSKSIVLDIYSGFINNFSVAMDLAKQEAKRKSALADFFKVKQISAHDRLSFFGLMVKPVQRIPQFILFLQDLLKHTPQGHHDRMSLQLALTQLESLAEMLNERKREAEQYQAFREMLGHINGTFNVRALASNDGARQRYLIREDNVTLLEFNTCGFVVKQKQRRLLLLNDRVICVSVAPKQSADFGATEKLSFKWMYPVTDVDIVDNNSTSATLSRILTAGINRGGSLKSNNSFDGSSNGTNGDALPQSGADNLCTEMSNLMHDYEVMSRISDLVGSLKGNYKDLSLNVVKSLLSTIQSSIQKKDEEMAWVDSCCMQIVVKNKSGKEETFTFQTENPNVKKEWFTELRLAQLALDSNNSPAWEISENEHRPLTKMPLFVRSQPIYKSQQQTEVRCGCYYTSNSNNVRLSTRRRTKNIKYLWLCSVDGQSSHIALFTQHQQQTGVLKDIGAFDLLEVTVTAMEFVKGMPSSSMNTACSLLNTDDSDLDCVWVATDNKKILLYLANTPNVPEQVAHCSLPAVANQMLYHMDNVFVALISGSVLIFRKNSEQAWNLKDYQTVPLSHQELITSLLPINGNVYAACGKKVWVINGSSGDVMKSFDVQHGNTTNSVANLMAHSGIGLWISLKNSSVICLYHTESFKHLQDINIASSVLKVTSSNQKQGNGGTDNNNSSVFVTALMACKGLLWVGTNVGIALTIPLPRLEGVPIISGAVSISYHAHFGPITFFLPLTTRNFNFPLASKVTPPNSTPASPELSENDAWKDGSNDNKDKEMTTTPKKTSEKDVTIDKLTKLLPTSPVVTRRRKLTNVQDMARTSKTLPRGLGSSAYANHNSVIYTDHGCDVYGLYGDLIFVKEDYDTESSRLAGNLIDATYETLRRSDPELAAIPAKVSTLDRRLKMKVSRPRSLDLSNWSMDSRSSSLYTSSGSEESMGLRALGSSSVSRNSSNASGHRFNGPELSNISENSVASTSEVNTPTSTATATIPSTPETDDKIQTSTPISKENNEKKVTNLTAATATTLSRKKAKHTQPVEIGPRQTVLTLMGGRGYINWRQIWFNTQDPGKGHSRNNSISVNNQQQAKLPNPNDAHIIIWENKL